MRTRSTPRDRAPRPAWIVLLLAAALVTPACESLAPADDVPEAFVAEQARLPDVDNLHVVGDRIATSAQPSPDELKAFAELGYTTVVNFRTAKEGAEREGELVERLGMTYVNIPVEGADIRFEHAHALRTALDTAPGGVLLHCSSGNRAAMAWALLLHELDDLTLAQTLEEARRAGMDKEPAARALRRRVEAGR